MKMKRTICLLSFLVFVVCLVCILCGCGSNNEFKFRDIPFGTKYKATIEKINKDLEAQKYDGKTRHYENEDRTYISDYYDGVDLYDYKVILELTFLNVQDEEVENAAFFSGMYEYNSNDAGAEEFFNFCKDKLTNKYGDSNISYTDEIKWIKGNTYCRLWMGKSIKNSQTVYIEYKSDNVLEKWGTAQEAAENQRNESKNKGL